MKPESTPLTKAELKAAVNLLEVELEVRTSEVKRLRAHVAGIKTLSKEELARLRVMRTSKGVKR